ncbi:MAG: transcriptional regulator [Rhodopirellula sp.]|nr:transcriptional regulator [Rhodopirellula sp.]
MQVLFADDEESLQELISYELPRMGHSVTVCPNGETALDALQQDHYDCLITDLDMPGMSGIDLIGKAGELSDEIECVVLTGKSTVESAIAALRYGAFDYLTKPCKLIEIEALLQRIESKQQLARKVKAVSHQLQRAEGNSQLLGENVLMQQVKSLISRVAPTPSTVLVRGETGTGKELVAREIHNQSDRADQPFVAVNCGALPENLIESELFGHCKGAFTGADAQRTGLFEMANHGTIMLDEIGELPKGVQAILLRVLESGEIRRVGDNQIFHVDVRVICATHRNLEDMVLNGNFREDLLFRINPFEIQIPSLRQRRDDIPLLAAHLYERQQGLVGSTKDNLQYLNVFTPKAITALETAEWKGNVRELANVIEHASILCDELPISIQHLPQRIHSGEATPPVSMPTADRMLAGKTLRELETWAISNALKRHNGNKPDTAKELGVSLKTLYNKLNNQLDKSA